MDSELSGEVIQGVKAAAGIEVFLILAVAALHFMSPDAMKAERGYPDVVMGDFIEDLIGDIEYNMGLVPANDSYFQELGLQRFTLEQLLREIDREKGVSPTAVVARFVEKMSASARDTGDPGFTFSVARDAAQSILDGLYFRD